MQEPQEMLLPEAVTAVAAGSRHTLFLAESGDVWSVGSNSHGQLGLGNHLSHSPAPRRIPALAGLPSWHSSGNLLQTGNNLRPCMH